MFLAFGEVMARFSPLGGNRWRQSLPGLVAVTWGGAEANVCASLAMFSAPIRFLSTLPRNPISESLVATLRGLGIDTEHILWSQCGRLGTFYLESGANQRGATVIYDRDHSSISMTPAEDYDFDKALEGVHWVHITGITSAISSHAASANLELVRRAKAIGATVSCDLNFRNKLWRWNPGDDPRTLARATMSELLPYVDLVIGNEEDAADMLDIHASGTDATQGQIEPDAYQDVARKIVERFPNISRVATTLRESISADHNNWGGMLYVADEDRCYFAPNDDQGDYSPLSIRNIVDRVGAGDSFAAGLLHTLGNQNDRGPDDAIAFAVAASCLKHSIPGDFNYATIAEVNALADGNATGRVQR